MVNKIMRYTQGQIRELLGVSIDAFRTWREAIPALSARKGHGPSFTPGDVVAMAVVSDLVGRFGLRVGMVGDRLDALFQICRNKSWPVLEACVVLLEGDSVRLVDSAAIGRAMLHGATICVPCAPIVARLREALTFAEGDQAQGHLHFAPTAVGATPKAGQA